MGRVSLQRQLTGKLNVHRVSPENGLAGKYYDEKRLKRLPYKVRFVLHELSLNGCNKFHLDTTAPRLVLPLLQLVPVSGNLSR